MNTQLKILLYILLVAGLLYYVQNKYQLFEISFDNTKEAKKEEVSEKESKRQGIEILNSEGRRIYVEVEAADTEQLRSQGLSGREELGDYQGMLFLFDEKGTYSFWMKDMNFPLDLIYIDETYYIVDIIENKQPCTQEECNSFVPSAPFKYVLEVKGGFCDVNRVDIGNAIIFDI